MDQSQVDKWVKKNLKRLMRLMGVPHWSISVKYDRIEGETQAHILPEMKYEIAYLTIDCPKLSDFEQLEKLLIHELGHVLMSPYTMFWDSISHTLPDGSIASFRELFVYAEEMAVKNIERMHAMHMEGKKKR